MKTLKIILGIFLSIGVLIEIPTFFENMSNGTGADALLGEASGILLFLAVIFYLLYSASNSKKELSEVKFIGQKILTLGGIVLVFLAGLPFLYFLISLVGSNIDVGTGIFGGFFFLGIAGVFFYVAIKDWNKLMAEIKRQKVGKQ